MADRALITKKVFKWARESAKMTEHVAASKISVSVDKLKEWESGESYPTIRQAQTLAQAYKRPFALFFLPDIPNDFQPLQDFRKKNSKELSTSSIFIIREIQQKQAWISEVYEEDKEDRVPFVGQFSIDDSPIEVANHILNTLDINPLHYQGKKPLSEWIDKAESKGIFISRTSFIHSRLKLDTNELQGFAIADDYAPFIFINSGDWDASQLFTLVHELAHIWIKQTGISNDIEPTINKSKDDYHRVELFCNEVAAHALIPEKYITDIENKTFDTSDEVFKVAKTIGVSSFSLLVRALNLNVITMETYKRLKSKAEQAYKDFLSKEEEKKKKAQQKEGGPNYFLLQLNRNSRLFTQTVFDAFRVGYIAPTQASSLLNVKINKFPKLEEQMYR